MRLFAVGSLFVFCALVASMAGAIDIGGAQPGTDKFSAIGLVECRDRICFRGIEPGITRWDELSAHLGSYMFDTSGSELAILPDAKIYGGFDSLSDGKPLHTLWVVMRNPTPAFITSDVVNRFGLPCAVLAADSRSELVYPSMTVQFDSSTGRLEMNAPVLEFRLYRPFAESCGGDSWIGFSRLTRYLYR